MNKKIIVSLSVVAAVAAITVGATTAFFSDTETSTGNTFTAGAIDLKIDNTSYVTSTTTGQLIASPWTSWALTDLTVEKFFDFIDLKPGDIGEDTISIHVGSNNAWLCAAAQTYNDEDNGITEPEEEDGDVDVDNNNLGDDNNDGELDENMNFVFWVDDGDNVLENCSGQTSGCEDETDSIFLEGTLSEMNSAGQITLADSESSILGGIGNPNPIPGDTTFYIGKAWCFGAITTPGIPQQTGGTPLTVGTGVTCDGTNVNNQSQTDMVQGDLEFYAEQSRNNLEFTCEDDYTPSWETD